MLSSSGLPDVDGVVRGGGKGELLLWVLLLWLVPRALMDLRAEKDGIVVASSRRA